MISNQWLVTNEQRADNSEREAETSEPRTDNGEREVSRRGDPASLLLLFDSCSLITDYHSQFGSRTKEHGGAEAGTHKGQ